MIRMAILSFAHYHANFWAEAFRAQTGIVLSSIWDDVPDRGRDAASRFSTSFEADLDRVLSGVDAVAICSETVAHASLVEKAARAGCAILCEKPLAIDMGEAERIRSAVSAAGVEFMQSFPKRFDPISHELKRLVDSKSLGKIRLVRVRHGHFYGLDPDFRNRWYVNPALSGGGALLDEGVHAADLLGWIFGKPAGVVASASATLGLEVEDQAIAVFDYADGMIAEIASSFTFAAADVSIEIYGSEGTVLVGGVDLASRDITNSAYARLYLRSQQDRAWQVLPIVPRFKTGQFHHQNAIAFSESLVERKPVPIGIDAGVDALRMIMCAYGSIRSGRRQPI